MSNAIDWEKLAQQLGTLDVHGESGGSETAQRAIEVLLGEDQLRATVDYYVSFGRGRELARTVLWQLHPWSAMTRCYEIYRSDADVETRTSAVELLRVVADRRALTWVEEFLADPHPDIQYCGAGIVDQLIWSHLVEPEDHEVLLQQMKVHPYDQVRETAAFISKYLHSRERSDPSPS